MKLSKYLRAAPYMIVILLTLSGAFFISSNNQKPLIFISKQQTTININENFWNYFNLGQKRLISSLYWVATILDSDVDHYKEKDLNSWMFIRFNTISILEPKFLENYIFGGPYLSIIKDDLLGADIIYDKGLKQYPDNYTLLLNSGFHYYFEQRNIEKAYPILLKLKNNSQSPPFIISSLARIETDRGNLDDSFTILFEYQKRFPESSPVWQKIQEQLYSIKAEKDLECLNNHKEKCLLIDLYGMPYLRKNNFFTAPREWTPYRPKWNKQ